MISFLPNKYIQIANFVFINQTHFFNITTFNSNFLDPQVHIDFSPRRNRAPVFSVDCARYLESNHFKNSAKHLTLFDTQTDSSVKICHLVQRLSLHLLMGFNLVGMHLNSIRTVLNFHFPLFTKQKVNGKVNRAVKKYSTKFILITV